MYKFTLKFHDSSISNIAWDIINYLIPGNGYIKTSCLKEILRELDDQLTDKELDIMIEEIDTDGSGTVDFDGKFVDYLLYSGTR